jgi:hypothetical protein
LVYAVHEIAIAAVLAMPAAPAEEADADALAQLPPFDAFAGHIDPPDRLVAGDPRPLNRQYPFDRRGIRMAHTTGLDTEADMASWRIDQRFFGHFQLTFAHRLNGSICRGAFHDLTPLSSPRVSEAGFRPVAPAVSSTEKPAKTFSAAAFRTAR